MASVREKNGKVIVSIRCETCGVNKADTKFRPDDTIACDKCWTKAGGK